MTIRPRLVALALAACPWWAQSQPPTVALRCALAPGGTVELLVMSHGLDGDSLLLRTGRQLSPAFPDVKGPPPIGHLVFKKCVRGTLIYAINQGPPYLKGAAWRVLPVGGQRQRLDFAEKALPLYLDLAAESMRLVFPNEGGEHDLPYTVYTTESDESQPATVMPRVGLARRIKLR
jgi:hypothetical protein